MSAEITYVEQRLRRLELELLQKDARIRELEALLAVVGSAS